MNVIQRINHWGVGRRDILQTILRIILGVILLQKGIFFLSNAEQLEELILQSNFKSGLTFFVSYIIFAHLFGGVFIIIGLLTRLVVLLQIPILIGALVFINPAQGGFIFNIEFLLSLVVLVLLIYFLIKGAGEVSIDTYSKKYLL